MRPHQHETSNKVIGAPPGYNENLGLGRPEELAGYCEPICITCLEISEQPAMVSFWKPTKEELEALNRGESVALTIYGHAHPMVWVGVESDYAQKPVGAA